MDINSKKIAIVYDWFDSWGGVERLLLMLHTLFPQAIFFTSYYDEKKASWARDLTVKTSFIQKLPIIKSNRKLSLCLYPYAFESFDFSEFDTVISVSSAFGKGVLTKPGTQHISILLTPTRYLWLYPETYVKNPFAKFLAEPLFERLRQWDYIAAQRADIVCSISKTVQARCKKFYRRNSEVLYPPFDTDYWDKLLKEPIKQFSQIKGEFYLLVSRLEPYKRVDLVIDAFKAMPDKNLVIVGKGTLKAYLEANLPQNCLFLDGISDQELASLYCQAQAVIMPQEEDYGYVALESQYCGCPVIAFGRGGATELISDGKTGILFANQTTADICSAVERFEKSAYNIRKFLSEYKSYIRETFSIELFAQRLRNIIHSYKLKKI